MSQQKVLILGGQGRIGKSVAQDLLTHTDAEVTITGRTQKQIVSKPNLQFLELDLSEIKRLREAIKEANLVIHCAGPFHYRDETVLKTCIDEKVNYIDVSDHRSFYQKLVPYQEDAIKAGVTAVLNTGIFPGISNSIVRQGIEKLDTAETIHLSYVVAGSGGAGITVMRTTFLGLRNPFDAWLNSQWKTVLPYTEREVIQFPKPYGKTGVYWFDMPETYTFADSFNVKNVITKFGSIPDFYNHLTWITAHVFPKSWIESKKGIEFFSKVSYNMTSVTDNFSGIGVAMRAEIKGTKNNQKAIYSATMAHQDTAFAAGCGTGTIAQFILDGKINQPGVYPVEQVLSTDLFTLAMHSRGIQIEEQLT
ncbi:saccharopine dehydrogenase family protein [Chroococcus sp. FPU101]|uniref:saccharopine dehydrogenase family protein n=1 Tax=Chroococcus sp. FPU101 TaxID=1974212 RepID=UPI001A8C3386|nr:saccharopine dehydrogenase NADP-binding domain-containing protein [Chroococcus sp. FPU101]GFE69156.1 saccharopine dehydrogenase [Chroococcus sp. FPU101]